MKAQTGTPSRNELTPRRAEWLARGAKATELLALAAGYLLLPLWPLVAGALARDWRYVSRYPRSVLAAVAHMRAGYRTHALARHLVRTLAPRGSAKPVGRCTHCGNCCLQKSCIFVEFDPAGHSSCRIYGTRLWKLLACGEYPVDAQDIELYACPSFSMPSAQIEAKVIVIHPVGVPAATGSGGFAIRDS
ncbi:MAG: hypothetical protein ACREU7_09285 [Burkholderiales bacterium]